jgi:hypothetical protein
VVFDENAFLGQKDGNTKKIMKPSFEKALKGRDMSA